MLDWRYFKPNAWNKLYKRSVIANVRYPKGKLHEDEYTTYKYMYNARKLVYIDFHFTIMIEEERIVLQEKSSEKQILMLAGHFVRE